MMKIKQGCNKRTATTMTARLKWLNRWLEGIGFSPICQEAFLHIYYCTLLSLLEEDDAQKLLRTVNSKLKTPYSEADLKRFIFKKKCYRYKDETIIRKLLISDEDCKKYGLNAKKEREQRRQAKKELYDDIRRYCENSFNPVSINELHNRYPEVSRSTLQRLTADIRRDKKTFDEMRVIALHREGKSVMEIVKATGYGKDKVYGILSFGKNPEFTILDQERATEPIWVSESLKEIFGLYKGESRDSAAAADEFMLSLKTLHFGGNVFITGPGGSGKSFLIKQFLDDLNSKTRKNTLIIAPTWKAASLMNGVSIHKAFQLELGVLPDTGITEIPKSLLNIEKIVIDEVSMVRIDIFTRIIKMIQYIEQSQDRKIQIIAVGDFGQIEPVATKDDVKLLKEYYPNANSTYAFESECWNQCHFTTISLKHIHRQNDTELTEQLIRLKYGDISTIEWFNEHLDHKDDPNAIYICPTNEVVNYYNYNALSRFKSSDIKSYTAITNGETDEQELPCPQTLDLAVGMRVMTILNTRQYKNGSIGTITTLSDDAVTVKFDNEKTCSIKRVAMTLDDGITFTQIPLVMAYAITANRAEGIELDAVNIVSGYFAAGQLYVALTRCKTREGMHLVDKLKKRDLIVNEAALRMTV